MFGHFGEDKTFDKVHSDSPEAVLQVPIYHWIRDSDTHLNVCTYLNYVSRTQNANLYFFFF